MQDNDINEDRAKLENSIPIIKGKKILFRGEKTKHFFSLTMEEKEILKSELLDLV